MNTPTKGEGQIEIPAEELERISVDAQDAADRIYPAGHVSTVAKFKIAYEIGAKAEYLRSVSPSIDREGWEEKYHVANLLLEEHKKLLHAAAPHLRDMEADNAHDPSVGMYKDQKLTELVKDLERYVYLNQPFPDRYPRWVKEYEKSPSKDESYHCKIRIPNDPPYPTVVIDVIDYQGGEWITGSVDERVIEWLEEQPSEPPAIPPSK